jgi:hypothetical protein
MSSACSTVLNTPELLEAILAQLPPKDLLLAQRISHCFATAIKSSPCLQQALYFRAVPVKDAQAWTINSLLRHHFLPFFTLPNDLQDIETVELMDWTKHDKKREAFLYKDASWRKMLVMQPSPKKLFVVQFCHCEGGDDVCDAELSFEDSQGLTMDAIYDITIAFLRNEEVSSFGLSILDSDTGPQVTLNLRAVIQCCVDEEDSSVSNLWSQGATADAHRELNFVFRKGEENDEGTYTEVRLNMDWTSDLTPERGGVSSYEFQKWKRDRVPISSILSDVR